MSAPPPPQPQQQDAPSTVLSELEAKLRSPDAVMEPGVGDLLREYLKAGGKPQAAIGEMSDGFIGYAHMASVVCEWLDIAEVDVGGSGGSGSTSGLASASSITRAFSASGRSFLQGGSASGGGGLAAAAAGGGRSACVPDEFTLLQELAKERFDSTRFLSVFKKGHPEWLNALIQTRQGRQLIYDLSAANRNSLLLNYAIQRILKRGHEDEVASVGGALASYFEVYHRLLVTRLAAASRATNEQQLRTVAREIVESCVANQHTYVHAQHLLTALAAQQPDGGVFRRLSQEVELAAVDRHGGARVYQMQPLFTPLAASPTECQAVQLVSEALTKSAASVPGSGMAGGAAGNKHSAAFITQQLGRAEPALMCLQQLYQQEQELGVQPLRHPQLMQLLLSGAFVVADSKPAAGAAAGSSNGRSVRQLCIQLLALAVAGRAQQGHETQQELEQRRSLSPDVPVAPGLAAVEEQLRHALALSHKMGSVKLAPADLDLATQVSRLPVAAVGLLQHAQRVLGEDGLFSEDRVSRVLPNHLSVLHRVACEQPGLIPQVLGVLRRVLTALGSSHMELSKGCLALLASLVVSGAADLALPVAEGWAAGADPSLIRHFIQLVLESVEPPYSQAFARAMLNMMHPSLILRIRGTHVSMLRGFARGCEGTTFLPPLSKRDQDLLYELDK